MNRERRKLLEKAGERAEGRISIWHVLESKKVAYFLTWV